MTPLHVRPTRRRVPPPTGEVWHHGRAGDAARGQPVRGAEESRSLRSDDHAQVTPAAQASLDDLRDTDILISPCLCCVDFCSSVFLSPNFYILDEPTNHLDMETIEALGKALNKFKVGVSSGCSSLPPAGSYVNLTCCKSHLPSFPSRAGSS